MNCENWRQWIQREQDGNLSPMERERLYQHLSTCPPCAAVAREMEEVSRLLSGLPRPEPPVSLVDRILEEAGPPPAGSGSRPRHRNRKWFYRLAPVGAAAAVVLVVIGLNHGLPTGGEEPRTLEDSDTKAVVNESLTPSDSAEKRGRTMESFPVEEGEWSPDGRYQAEVSERRVIVRKKSGEMVYRSDPVEGKVRLVWEDGDTLILQFPESGERKRIRLPTPGKTKSSSQNGGAQNGSQADSGD